MSRQQLAEKSKIRTTIIASRLLLYQHTGGSNGSINYSVRHEHVVEEELPEQQGQHHISNQHKKDNSKLRAEAQIALVPASVLYVPGDPNSPPVGIFSIADPLRGSYDPIGALGMALETGKLTVYAFKFEDSQDTTLDTREWTEVTKSALLEIDCMLNERADGLSNEVLEEVDVLNQLMTGPPRLNEQEARKELKLLTTKGVLDVEYDEEDGLKRIYSRGLNYMIAWEIFKSVYFLDMVIADRANSVVHEVKALLQAIQDTNEDEEHAVVLDVFEAQRLEDFAALDSKGEELREAT